MGSLVLIGVEGFQPCLLVDATDLSMFPHFVSAEEIGGNLTWYPPDDASEVTATWFFLGVGEGSKLLFLPRAIGCQGLLA